MSGLKVQDCPSDQSFIIYCGYGFNLFLSPVNTFNDFCNTVCNLLDHCKFSYTVFLAESAQVLIFVLLKSTIILCHINTVLLTLKWKIVVLLLFI